MCVLNPSIPIEPPPCDPGQKRGTFLRARPPLQNKIGIQVCMIRDLFSHTKAQHIRSPGDTVNTNGHAQMYTCKCVHKSTVLW